MKPFPVPIVPFGLLGPNSQPEEEVLDYLPMPKGMHTFSMPSLARIDTGSGIAEARALLEELLGAMSAWRFGAGTPPRIDLGRLSPDALIQVNQSLGEGEVSILVQGGQRLNIQETVFAGIWRVQELGADDSLLSDWLEVGAIPEVVRQACLGSPTMALPPEPPGLMNAPALAREIADHASRYQAGQPAHILNLTLLPVTPQDLEYLSDALGFGHTSILSRGYGNCRITATGVGNVWWVQYFNSMDRLILNTLEVVDVPEVALAAREDFEDSIARLGEWLTTLTDD